MTTEQERLADPDRWKRWGPYLAERSWGTVREDYSADGEAWSAFTHDQARSRTYRWNEDGLGGLCDVHQRLCFALAFWNGVDPILKERLYGLTGKEGNHGEDAKEYWWFLDSTPTHSWMRWRYWYPQREFPYADLLTTNQQRSRLEPEYELIDTGVFNEDRYWDITVDYAKAGPDDWCITVRVRNAGPDAATLHVLPTIWFRNTWSWGLDDNKPTVAARGSSLVAERHDFGRMLLTSDSSCSPLVCDNETNSQRLWGTAGSPYPKDGINDHVVTGAPTVNPQGVGTKGSLWHQVTVEAGETAVLRLRLGPDAEDLGAEFEAVTTARSAEADQFYQQLLGALDPEAAMIARQAFAGMMWTKQWYHFDVERWLSGDPAGPPPSAARQWGRNGDWVHLNNADVLTVCDTWEYPWYATWDLAFQCVAIAHVDARFAKDQLRLMCREWYMHPNGQLPAYEWEFGDVNPPVHAWAALRVFGIDARASGTPDYVFLEQIFQKLLLNFTWWVNRKDADGDNVFGGGFLGMDNIGPINRSEPLPEGDTLEQSDATAWMALFSLNMLEIALVLAEYRSPAYEDMCTKFLEHFAYIAAAINDQGLWDDADGFFYDVLRIGNQSTSLKVRSMVGLLPLCAVTTLGPRTLERLPDFARRLDWFIRNKPKFAAHLDRRHEREGVEGRLLAMVDHDRLTRILARLLDETEMLSAHGVRSVSARHRDQPFTLQLNGTSFVVEYNPGESTSGLFGGNSNWRGPVWFPVNALVIEALRAYGRFFGADETVEHPVGSGQRLALSAVADDLADRLVSLFRNDSQGLRPVYGGYQKFNADPAWHDCIPFHEYFHGDTGAGLGASHQTGWTGLVADLLLRRE
ncbi:MAG: hypothetical protein JWL70_2062 [Acidimicrobiia bacterium]|nr:hypothetical protein [Acidimicrobiia bacterium]